MIFLFSQFGECALSKAASEGRTELISLLLKDSATLYLQNEVSESIRDSKL